MDIGEFYQRVRRMLKRGQSTTKMSYNGIEATNDSSILELWCEHFFDLYSKQPTKCFNEIISMKFRQKCKHTLKKVIKHLFQNLKKKLSWKKCVNKYILLRVEKHRDRSVLLTNMYFMAVIK